MGRTGFSEGEMDESISRLKRAINRMNEWLEDSSGPWLMGSKMTISDIAIMPVIIRMDDINLSELWKEFPLIKNWLKNIKETHSFQQTYYFGSLLTEKYPHLKNMRKKND